MIEKSCWLHESFVRSFLLVGRFSAVEWLKLTDEEKAFVLEVSGRMDVERALMVSAAVSDPGAVLDTIQTDEDRDAGAVRSVMAEEVRNAEFAEVAL